MALLAKAVLNFALLLQVAAQFVHYQPGQLICAPGGIINLVVIESTQFYCDRPDTPMTESIFVRNLAPHFATKLVNASWSSRGLSIGLLHLDPCYSDRRVVDLLKRVRPAWTSPNGLGLGGGFCHQLVDSLREQFYFAHAVISGWRSSETQLVSSQVSLYSMPQVGNECSSDTLSDKALYPNLFRLVAPDSYQAKAVVDLVLHFNWTLVGIVHRDDVYGRGLLQNTRLLLQQATTTERRTCLAFSFPVNEFLKIKDFWVELNKFPHLKVFLIFETFNSIPDFVFEAITGRNGIIVTTDTNSEAYKYYTMGSFYISFPRFSTPDFIQFYHSLNATEVLGFPWGDRLLRLLFNCSTDAAAACCSTGSCRIGDKSSVSTDTVVAPVARLLDSISILVACIERVAFIDCADVWPNVTAVSACVTGQKVMRLLANSSFPLMRTGNVSFDANGDGSPAYEVRQEQPDGRLTKVGTWTESSGLVLTGPDLTPIRWWRNSSSDPQQLQQQVPSSFCSAPCSAGEIRLDTDACCFTCKACFKQEVVSVDGRSCLSCPEFHWPSADRLSCGPISVYVWRDGMQFPLLLACLAVLLIFLLIVLAMFINQREHKLIKASSIHLSVTCMSGNLLGMVCLALFAADSSDAVCNALNCSFQLSLSACYASQLVKTLRVHLIFSASTMGRPVPWLARQKPMLITLTGVILGMCALLTVVTALRPLRAELNQIVTDSLKPPFVERNCAIAATAFWTPLCCNLLILTVTCGLSLKTRSLPDNFHDTKCILASGVSGLFLWSAFVPSALTANSLTTAMLLLAFSCSLTHALLLSILFAPKLYAVYARSDSENNVQFYTTNPATAGTPSGS